MRLPFRKSTPKKILIKFPGREFFLLPIPCAGMQKIAGWLTSDGLVFQISGKHPQVV